MAECHHKSMCRCAGKKTHGHSKNRGVFNTFFGADLPNFCGANLRNGGPIDSSQNPHQDRT